MYLIAYDKDNNDGKDLTCVCGTLQPGGQLPGGLVRLLLQVLVTQRRAGQRDRAVEEAAAQRRQRHQRHRGRARVLAEDGHLANGR